jgi:hypothetical protein
MLKVIFSTEVVGACSGEKTKENEIHVCRLSLLHSTTFFPLATSIILPLPYLYGPAVNNKPS